jgi:hypothetical protein
MHGSAIAIIGEIAFLSVSPQAVVLSRIIAHQSLIVAL